MKLGPLTTPKKVFDYLQMDRQVESTEIVVNDLIDIASDKVREFTGRTLSTKKETETREFVVPVNDHRVYVDDVEDFSLVTTVTDGLGSAPDYRVVQDSPGGRVSVGSPSRGAWLVFDSLLPKRVFAGSGLAGRYLPEDHADDFIVQRARVSEYPTREERTVRVTGVFGYDEDRVPKAIEFATRRAVALWYREEIAHYTDDAFISRGVRFDPDELPPLSVAMLRGWVIQTPAFA